VERRARRERNSAFLLAFGAWSWVMWGTSIKNPCEDVSWLAFDNGSPTAYPWVHLALAITPFTLGSAVGGLCVRAAQQTEE